MIRAQMDAEAARPRDDATVIALAQAERIAVLEGRLATTERDLARARRLIGVLRTALTDLRRERAHLWDRATTCYRELVDGGRLAHAFGANAMASRMGLPDLPPPPAPREGQSR